MCGIVGMFSSGDEPVSYTLYDALTVIQHRGQDAAGIATVDGNRYFQHRDAGMVRDAFSDADIRNLQGNMGIGHCRYPTAGSSACDQAQPFYVNSPYGISLAHNGNLTNTAQLRHELLEEDHRHLNTDSDSEVLLNILAHELSEVASTRPDPDEIFAAVTRVHERVEGAYAVVVLIIGVGLLAFRDPHGIRPLSIGLREHPDGSGTPPDVLFASESVAMTPFDFELHRPVHPGEAVFVDLAGGIHAHRCDPNAVLKPCVFEFVYLARPESLIDEISVYKSRLRMGDRLAHRILDEWPGEQIDVVIPIPDTSRTSALPIAHQLGVKYREGFIKNRYVGRTFIMPGQAQRNRSIKQKLNAVPLEFDGKNVLLVDDSIVRGNTSRQIVQMAREAGAKKVFFASAAPPVRYQNVYGIDMPARTELIAHGKTIDEIREALGADRLIYQNLDDLVACISEGNPNIDGCDTSCFDGQYVTGTISSDYLHRVAEERNDLAKIKRNQEEDGTDDDECPAESSARRRIV